MTQQLSLLTLAKQGNADAIAALMNRSLQTKGIAAKASLKDGCLQVMLESAQVPEQQAVVEFIRKGVTGLESRAIKAVKVCGKQVGEDFPTWEREFEITSTSNESAAGMLSTASLLQATSSRRYTLKQSRNQQPSNAHPRAYLVPSIVFVLLSFLAIGIAATVFAALRSPSFNPSPQSRADKTSQAEAKQNIKAINRAQQAFYLEKDAFAPTVAVLGIGISSETASYDYKVSDVDQTKAISVATAKVNGLKSYTGAVFAVRTANGLNITVAGTCVTDTPPYKLLKSSPNLPQLIGEDIKCPSDSFDVLSR